jgi:hypothetical protein
MLALAKYTAFASLYLAAVAVRPCCGQQEFSHSSGSTPELRASTFSLWIPAMPAASTVRGVLAVGDYESGREMVRGKRPQFPIDQREQIVHGWAVARTRFVESFSHRNAQQHSGCSRFTS